LNPLLKVREAFQNGVLPKKEYSLIVKRFPIVVSGITRIEKASGVDFPIAYVEPSITISTSGTNSFEYGILFARTIPVVTNNTLQVVIQISAPLVSYFSSFPSVAPSSLQATMVDAIAPKPHAVTFLSCKTL